jgi:hypothetical protein
MVNTPLPRRGNRLRSTGYVGLIAYEASGRSRHGRRGIRTNPSGARTRTNPRCGAAANPNEPETRRIAGSPARAGAHEPDRGELWLTPWPPAPAPPGCAPLASAALRQDHRTLGSSLHRPGTSPAAPPRCAGAEPSRRVTGIPMVAWTGHDTDRVWLTDDPFRAGSSDRGG